jgi:hypothetical protein
VDLRTHDLARRCRPPDGPDGSNGASQAIVAANRGLGPEVPMKLVEERAPNGFADIADVISEEEIAEVTEAYRRTAGFALAALQRGTSLLDEPCDS